MQNRTHQVYAFFWDLSKHITQEYNAYNTIHAIATSTKRWDCATVSITPCSLESQRSTPLTAADQYEPQPQRFYCMSNSQFCHSKKSYLWRRRRHATLSLSLSLSNQTLIISGGHGKRSEIPRVGLSMEMPQDYSNTNKEIIVSSFSPRKVFALMKNIKTIGMFPMHRTHQIMNFMGWIKWNWTTIIVGKRDKNSPMHWWICCANG